MLKPEVFATVMDFFASGLPLVTEEAKAAQDASTCCVACGVPTFMYQLTRVRVPLCVVERKALNGIGMLCCRRFVSDSALFGWYSTRSIQPALYL